MSDQPQEKKYDFVFESGICDLLAMSKLIEGLLQTWQEQGVLKPQDIQKERAAIYRLCTEPLPDFIARSLLHSREMSCIKIQAILQFIEYLKKELFTAEDDLEFLDKLVTSYLDKVWNKEES